MGSSAKATTVSGLEEMIQKAEVSLLPAIEEHMKSREFDARKDGLDFLEVKNSLLLSYLIDLTYHVRERVCKKHDEDHYRRLLEMRTALDKTRPLEKKMRYQLDKLLAATATSHSFAEHQDPLSYRPDPSALRDEEDDSSSDEDSVSSLPDDADDDGMDDLEAAQATLKRARQKQQQEKDEDDAVYRAPRFASMPYPKDDEGRGKERQQRMNRRMRTTELAQALRSQFGEAPEQEDVHGGADVGRQREAARRLAEREKAKTDFEEENMVRLTTSRKEKKERKRLMREEHSNLAAIADLGNLVRGVSSAFHDDNEDREENLAVRSSRHSKRKRDVVDEASGHSRKGRKANEAKNTFQKALYGSEGGKEKKKKKHR